MATTDDQIRHLDYVARARLLADIADECINKQKQSPERYIRWLRSELRQLWEETAEQRYGT